MPNCPTCGHPTRQAPQTWNMTCARCGKHKYPYQTYQPEPPFYCTLCRTRPWIIVIDPYTENLSADWRVQEGTSSQTLKQIAKEIQAKRSLLNIPDRQPYVRIYAQDPDSQVAKTLTDALKLVVFITPRTPVEEDSPAIIRQDLGKIE